MGLVEEAQARLVGVRLLRHREGKVRPQPHLLAAQHRGAGGARVVRGDGGAGAQHHRDDRLDGGVLHRLFRADQVAARDVAGLVRDDADQLVRRLAAHDRAGVDEYVLTACDEGIQRGIVDDIDVHGRGL